MRNIPVKSPGSKFYSYECNDMASEEENLILSTGISLTEGDLYQMAKSVANYSCAGDYYTDTGSADNYILTATPPIQAPTTYIAGFRARFMVANTNTGASQININGLGIKPIKDHFGNDLIGGELIGGQISEIVYTGTYFVIFNSTQSSDITKDILKMQYPYNGLLISNNIANPTTHLDISTGWFIDSGYNGIFHSPSIFVKDISSNWAIGSGNGGFPSGLTLTANKFYHYFGIVKGDKTVDYGWDDLLTAANLLADASGSGFIYYKYICSIKTDASLNIHAIINNEIGKTRYIFYKEPILDINLLNPPTTEQLRIISTPLNIKTIAILNVRVDCGAETGDRLLYVSSPDVVDMNPVPSVSPLASQASVPTKSGYTQIFVLTDLTSKIRVRVDNTSVSTTIHGVTLGWIY